MWIRTICRVVKVSLFLSSIYSKFKVLIWCNLKTLLGAWTTSNRLHEEHRKQCLFGCSAPDLWSHYIRCESMWRLLCTGFDHQLIEDPGDRLHDLLITRSGMILLALAFVVYHMTKSYPHGDLNEIIKIAIDTFGLSANRRSIVVQCAVPH